MKFVNTQIIIFKDICTRTVYNDQYNQTQKHFPTFKFKNLPDNEAKTQILKMTRKQRNSEDDKTTKNFCTVKRQQPFVKRYSSVRVWSGFER